MYNLLQKKEKEFIEHPMNRKIGKILEDLGIDTSSIRMNNLLTLYLEMSEEFVFYLLTDDDFLNTTIIGHFYEERGIHTFGIDLLDIQEPCSYCGDVFTEWVALQVNTSTNKVSLFYDKECYDSTVVEDSSYCGKPLKSILPLIDKYYSAEIIK